VCSIVALCFQLFGVEGQGFVTAVMAALLALCVCDMHDVRVLFKAFKKQMKNEITVIWTLFTIALLTIITAAIFNSKMGIAGWITFIVIVVYCNFRICKKLKK
jgi:energy-coupling factor transporter transmembrane protein EcfT